MKRKQNLTNHITLVLDRSYSMLHLANQVIKVTDAQIAYLAQRSKELDQETRVTIYVFDDNVECVIYDMDVLRLPSIAELYKIGGNTALVQATLQGISDLKKTPELYGDHAFLMYVVTDGQENASQPMSLRRDPSILSNEIASLPDNWTVAVFVPDANGVYEAKRFGFPKDNIAIWDATSEKGVAEMGRVMQATTDSYMDSRAKGVRGTKKLFTVDTSKLSRETVNAKNMETFKKGTYVVLNVEEDTPIAKFVEANGHTFLLGKGYYQLMKPEVIQANKAIVVRRRKTGYFYTGPEARALIGLPNHEIKVAPDPNMVDGFDIFVQSMSNNRKLIAGTKFVYVTV